MLFQFTKDELSGICIFNLSRDVNKYLKDNKKVEIVVDLVPDYNRAYIECYLKEFSDYNAGYICPPVPPAVTITFKSLHLYLNYIIKECFFSPLYYITLHCLICCFLKIYFCFYNFTIIYTLIFKRF